MIKSRTTHKKQPYVFTGKLEPTKKEIASKLRHFGASRNSFIEHDRKKRTGWQMHYEDNLEQAIMRAGLS